MAESHHPLFSCESVAHPSLGPFRLADFNHHGGHSFVRTSMKRSFQGCHCRGDRPVQVGKARSYDACGERGRVELVLRVENQRHTQNPCHRVVQFVVLPVSHKIEQVVREPQSSDRPGRLPSPRT